jgi:hypothetical protein
MSSLKAGQGLSHYLKTRGEAESLVRASPLEWTIYQPSVIFGDGDGLVTRFAALLRKMPVLPLARAKSRLAPTYVGDVAEAIARCVATTNWPAPQLRTLRPRSADAGRDRARHPRCGRPCVHRSSAARQPRVACRPRSPACCLASPSRSDNFLSLRTDSVGKTDGYAALGIVPQPFTPWLPRLILVAQNRLNEARARQFNIHGSRINHAALQTFNRRQTRHEQATNLSPTYGFSSVRIACQNIPTYFGKTCKYFHKSI